MKSLFPGALLFALTLVPGAAVTEDLRVPSDGRGEASEPVRVQPRGRSFAPGSAEDDDVQRRIDSFNAAQRDLDRVFDRKLTICRRC